VIDLRGPIILREPPIDRKNLTGLKKGAKSSQFSSPIVGATNSLLTQQPRQNIKENKTKQHNVQ
jgi:hypothetical protein